MYWQVELRWIGIIGLLAVLAAVLAQAGDRKKLCVDLLDDADRSDRPEQRTETLLTEDQCEAAKQQEFRVPLLEIPQEDEDPMALSLGAKQGGGILRFKIPFSF